MNGKNIIFDDKKVKKSSFYKNKKIFMIDNIDVNKILISKKEPWCANKSIKYFIKYNDEDVIRLLYIKLPQMIGYVKCFNNNNNNNNNNNLNSLNRNDLLLLVGTNCLA